MLKRFQSRASAVDFWEDPLADDYNILNGFLNYFQPISLPNCPFNVFGNRQGGAESFL